MAKTGFFAALALGALLLTAAPRPGVAADKGNAAPQVNQPNKPSKTSNPSSTRAVLDVNSASKDELKDLPGIGETYSQRIIENRPYRDKRDLVRRNVVPKTVYNGIKDRVTAHRTQQKPVTSQPTK